mmetsp:Transcript_34351/g.41106  ORF Transcript_34351/g.41106 Transcript_34351/m.41106 type:complete len:133 (-) Transcript_34351:273-671(-)|eukprot:CAMPEP_0198248314 /NCGR_PEP_ID=MMETSP1447-20131203/70_1 /TAXON_ID=420782 /ORGANISM="Chaetoceros dichaeta, Strain CCMP1751" /LENGTH=132 /DNA_ID=CAMNT_0043932657 /DNA_START=106 /DNA_END=504 /DNA_ORIENTATION=+
MDSSIPIMREPTNVMACGPNSNNFAAKGLKAHPIDRMQRASGNTQSSLDVDAIRRLYGSGLAMRLATERKLASSVGGRLPGLDAHPNSNMVLETLTGDDCTIDFGQFLNTRETRPELQKGGPHDAMEAKLGL